jgi:cardiolipin synthase
MVIGTAAFPALETRPIPDVGRGEPMDLAEWEHGLDRLTGRPTSYGTIKLLIDGEEYFDRMLAAIDAADESIDVRTYIFDNDDFGVRVADYLRRKSRQVDVRVMFDGLGNLMALQTDPDSMPAKFVAPISMERYLEYDSKVRVRTLNNPWLTGDHTKTTIIDREVAFIGGMNIGREYRYDWHDVMMEVRGPVVDQLAYDADKAWARASVFGDVAYLLTAIKGKRKTADRHGYPVRTLYTREFDSEIFRAQLEAIRRARQYIYIENSYFSDDATLYELARARRRGVDVRIILPADGNHGSHDASNAVAINRMLRNGIRVYRFPGMSHVKAAVIDGWASLGTANFDKLSLQVNKEVNLATSHAPFVELLLQRVFYADMERSDEVTEAVDITLQARLMEMLADEVL